MPGRRDADPVLGMFMLAIIIESVILGVLYFRGP